MPNGKARITEQISNTFPKDDDTMPRFPRLQDCAHFHYEYTEFGPLHIRLNDEEEDARTVIGKNRLSLSYEIPDLNKKNMKNDINVN